MATILEEDAVIIGAGIAGLATAVALKRLGIRALVLEKADGLRATGAALTLFPNAWLALDALGVSHKLTSIYPRTKRGLITNIRTGATQEISFVTTTGIESGPRSVHRRTLLEALADELPINTIHFSAKVSAIETETLEGSSIAVIHLGDGTIIKAKILIGCDGVHSTVARWLGLSAPVDSGRSSVRGMAVFPEGHGLNQEVRQFVDAGIRAGFIPLNDKEIYWFLNYKCLPKGENTSANPELIQKELLENYAEIMPPLYLDVVRHCDLSTLTRAPLMFRYPWDIMFGNLSKGNITVAGDAMHPMTPDLAQGGCSALEDAVVLGRHIGNSLIKHNALVSGGISEAVDGYVKERRWRITWLVAGAYLSGWVQQGGSKWWMKFLRDVVFYKLLFSRIVNTIQYDCGKLPRIPFAGEFDNSNKID
ncbi:FAD-dependent urate hydroxylase [Melia azedarach]|uniref:FAD-dependent urate hydroxylase n=1 Tax=Melia azedarach TaxID=155640 RepID=A0ACC1XXJ4_MELAZ|nr:FAD-dependent urate hydroxylase [Melia azedarach]